MGSINLGRVKGDVIILKETTPETRDDGSKLLSGDLWINSRDYNIYKHNGTTFEPTGVNIKGEKGDKGDDVDVGNVYLLSGGTGIPDSADMDAYREVGNYYCNANTTVATLTNAPFTSAFTLKVILSAGTGYPFQIFRRFSDGVVACRCYTPSASAWGNYHYYSSDDMVLDKLNSQVFDLKTTDKTLPGAINEINDTSWLLTVGTEIPASANMDNYTDPGNYYCFNGINVQTLVNAPPVFTSGFMLKVVQANVSGFPMQIYTDRNGNTAVRVRQDNLPTAENTWSGYNYFYGVSDDPYEVYEVPKPENLQSRVSSIDTWDVTLIKQKNSKMVTARINILGSLLDGEDSFAWNNMFESPVGFAPYSEDGNVTTYTHVGVNAYGHIFNMWFSGNLSNNTGSCSVRAYRTEGRYDESSYGKIEIQTTFTYPTF